LNETILKYALIAPRGTSAANISGITIHSFLKLTKKSDSNYPILAHNNLPKNFAESVKELSYIIIDERC